VAKDVHSQVAVDILHHFELPPLGLLSCPGRGPCINLLPRTNEVYRTRVFLGNFEYLGHSSQNPGYILGYNGPEDDGDKLQHERPWDQAATV
jgi:hypothetical protein